MFYTWNEGSSTEYDCAEDTDDQRVIEIVVVWVRKIALCERRGGWAGIRAFGIMIVRTA
jgi:hypothetical protein